MRKVIRPVELINTREEKDIIIQAKKGHFSVDAGGNEFKQIPTGGFYFIPRESTINFRHGIGPYDKVGAEGFTNPEQRERYVRPIHPVAGLMESEHVFNILAFEVNVYGAVPFFSIMQLPCILIDPNEELSEIINNIMLEEAHDGLGKNAMVRKYTDQLIIHLCRYIYDNPVYREQVAKLDYLLDQRLVNIIEYIQNNLAGDLSNQKIADLAFVSRDYIGQFFKSLTNNNLQDYIENRRLEQAHFLLRSTNESVQEIARKVGFKDPAYFSRRFRLKYNQKARDIRESDVMIA
ncbi:MAG: helix-turn-helix transcriptional regulator [Bacteroidota bacterium]